MITAAQTILENPVPQFVLQAASGGAAGCAAGWDSGGHVVHQAEGIVDVVVALFWAEFLVIRHSGSFKQIIKLIYDVPEPTLLSS